MFEFQKHFDYGSLVVIALTLVLFVAALFSKGFTHDLLLEAGVFLVSVKLILMAYRNSLAYKEMGQKIDRICACVLKEADRERN
jgi:hypothetical protein